MGGLKSKRAVAPAAGISQQSLLNIKKRRNSATVLPSARSPVSKANRNTAIKTTECMHVSLFFLLSQEALFGRLFYDAVSTVGYE